LAFLGIGCNGFSAPMAFGSYSRLTALFPSMKKKEFFFISNGQSIVQTLKCIRVHRLLHNVLWTIMKTQPNTWLTIGSDSDAKEREISWKMKNSCGFLGFAVWPHVHGTFL
jgi:hypothetical protein